VISIVFLCLSVCLFLCKHVSGTTCPNITKFSMHFASSVAMARCSYGDVDTLRPSGFEDNVTFSDSGPYGTGRLAQVWCNPKATRQVAAAGRGRNLMPTISLLCF